MGGPMKGGAVVEPDALKDMKRDTDELAANLKKAADSLIKRTEELNNAGFKDNNFANLYKVIQEKKTDLEKLNDVMLTFSEYLEKSEKITRKLHDEDKIKSTNIKIE